MPFLVQLTDDATGDLEEIYDFIERKEVSGWPDRVSEQIEKAFHRLSENPERGNIPRESEGIGIREFREVFFKPYLIILFKKARPSSDSTGPFSRKWLNRRRNVLG